MTVLLTLTTAGSDSDSFSLYSNLDGYVSSFETGISRAGLLAGYTTALVPDYTTTIRVKSNSNCINYVDIILPEYTTTTTTTSTTTSSTTTAYPGPYLFNLSNSVPSSSCPSGISSFPLAVYAATSLSLGVIVYYDIALTLPFAGDSTWYWVTGTTGYQIDGTGTILAISDCSPV